jgi:hypothetical protein
VDGLHFQPLRLETVSVPGDRTPGNVFVVLVARGRFEFNDLGGAPGFGFAKAVTVGRVTERIGEVVAIVVVPISFFTLEFGPFFLGDVGAVLDVLQEAPLGGTLALMDDVRLDEAFLAAFAIGFLDQR